MAARSLAELEGAVRRIRAARLDSGSFVLLHIGERRFAFPASLVAELAQAVRLHRFPHTSPQLLGAIIRRGKIVPVYDPRSVFGAKRSFANLFYLLAECKFGAATELFAVPINGEDRARAGRTPAVWKFRRR